MLPRLSPLLRTSTFPTSMARVIPRAAAVPLSHPPNAVAFVGLPSARLGFVANANRFGFVSQSLKPSISDGQGLSPLRGRVWASQREYRKVRRRAAKSKEKELELNVSICIEEDLPDDPEVLSIAEMLRLNVPMAMKLAFDGLKDSTYKTRDTAINDVGGFESVELSVLLCNDEFIRKLNKEWRDEDHATDVLSMSEHVPELKLPILMLGDIVISVETAARQAEERGHTLLDEIRILMVHGLLHLLGFDHELSEEAEAEMEKEEELLLKSLGWKGKGLIQSAYDAENSAYSHKENTDDRKKEGSLRFYKPKFKYIFCDMDGTLLNSKSQVTPANAKALKEAMSRGVKVVIATGKARPAVIESLKMVDLAGKDGIVSEFSPGVFLQDLPNVVAVNVLMSSKGSVMVKVALEILQLLRSMDFIELIKMVSIIFINHYYVKRLNYNNVSRSNPKCTKLVGVQIMAIGDGENDIEMLELAMLGIALSNGSEKTKAVANAIGVSNDEDGVADAIYRYAF
nr:endoribonuclease YBEY, chloroplastic-like [Quercus suber]